MNRSILSFFAGAALLGGGCSESGPARPEQQQEQPTESQYVEAVRIPKAPEPEPAAAPAEAGQPYRGGSIVVTGKALRVNDSAGRMITENPGIILGVDESGTCPSEGFQQVVVSGDYFTIEQQNCGGMLFSDEYITFKAASDGRIYLHKFTIVQTDRSDPERKIPQRTLATKDFGSLELKDVEVQKLYRMF